MRIIQEKISNQELKNIADASFGGLVKAVVDIEKEIMAIDAELHADLEELLLENESQQKDLWGINFHPDKVSEDEWIEFDSMINLRPSMGNRSRGVDDPKIREKIVTVVNKLVTK